MRRVLESKVERYLVSSLFKIGIDCVKFVPDCLPGMPDRMVILPDRQVMWVELKTDGGKLSEIQKYRHTWLKKIGHDVRVVWSKDQVDNLVNELKNDQIEQVK